MGERPGLPPNLVMLVSVSAVSTASILIRLTAAPPMAIATWRLVLSTLMLLPFFAWRGGFAKLRAMGGRDLLALAGVGVALAVHFASWITSLSFTSVASSVIFVHVDSIFVALVSHFVLGERVSRRVALGIGVAFVGAAVIALGDLGVGEENLVGDALSIIGAVALGVYLMAGRRLRQRLDLTTYVTPVYAVSAAVLALGSVAVGAPLVGYDAGVMLMFAAIALVPMIFGHTLYNWVLRWVSAPVVSISLLGEPVGASILAFLILGESPGPLTLIGGAVTLAGILICTYQPAGR
ncbi:MAG: DMT family transporter [Candidatus Bathyarchaeota archaeon]|nr:DMT family transporter [Candidatus Bathyarchaeota archaeon]